MRTVSGGVNYTDYTSPIGYSSCSSEDTAGGHYADNAYEGTAGSIYWVPTSSTVPQWIGWVFNTGAFKDIQHITLYTPSNGLAAPTAADVQYSDDGATWTTAWSITSAGVAGVTYSFQYYPPNPGTMALTCPAPTVAGESLAPQVVSCPTPSITAYGGGSAALSAPTAPVSATGHDSSGERVALLTAPSPTLAACGGASATLTAPTFILSISGTVMNWGTATIKPPSATSAASGTVSGSATAALTAPTSKLIGYFGAVASITLTGSPTITASGTSGGVGKAAISVPLFDLSASGTVRDLSYANLLAPSARLGATAQAWIIAPGATLTAIGHAVVTATYEAYALNLNHTPRYSAGKPVTPVDELTHYTNFPFTQIVRYQNSYFGVAADGLYLLEGTTDDGAPISWDVQTAFTDFDSPQLKTLEMAYFGGRFGPVTTITLLVGEASTESYVYTTPLDATAKNYRQPFGRGLKARYYAVAAEGTGEVAIDSVNFNIATLARRI